MLKKTITYTDYNGLTRTEDFFFNLSKADMMEMELTTEGGLAEMLKKIVNTKDTSAIIKFFKELILKAYGEKSADGKHFIKINDAGIPVANAFSQTEAYSVLFMELLTDADKAAAFVNGIIPPDMITDDVKAEAKAFIESKVR